MRIYGPVPSRRFGLSLGIDIVPHKTCQFDCIYCQLGPTDHLSATTENFYTIEEIVADAKEALKDGPEPDVITLAGSGDPSLYASLSDLIDALKELSSAPVLYITNSSMLHIPEVAAAALKADIFAPSLDAGDEETFKQINCPHPDVTFDNVIKGLQSVTNAHPGEIRLEVMLLKGINDSEQSIRAIAQIVETLKVDRIDLNTPVRPPIPERGAIPCDESVLELAKSIFGPKAHSIGNFEKKRDVPSSQGRSFNDMDKDVRETLLRRPCTQEDICASLRMSPEDTSNTIDRLLNAGLIYPRENEGRTYYHTTSANPTIRDLK